MQNSAIHSTILSPDFAYSTFEHSRLRDPIIVALDGTPASERAIPFALRMARRWNAPLRLVHVQDAFNDTEGAELCVVDNHESLAVHSRSGAYLNSLSESLRAAHGVRVDYHVSAGTSIINTLLELCETNATALVMARSTRSAMSRFWAGSTTNRIVGQLTVPLLIVPSQATSTRDTESGFNRVLVYLDGKQPDSVIDAAAKMASPGAVCHLVRALPIHLLYATGRGAFSQSFKLRNEAWFQIFRAKEKLERNGIDCRPRVIFDGRSAGPAILAQAQVAKPDLVIVSSGKARLPWRLRKSVADYVVRHSEIPALIVPHGL